jgi:uncharacterized membrane protein (DUF4010 family)
MSAKYLGNQFEIALTTNATTLPAALAAQNYTANGNLSINSTLITCPTNQSFTYSLKVQARSGNISYTHAGNAPVSGSHGFILGQGNITHFTGNLSAIQFAGEGANATLTGVFQKP